MIGFIADKIPKSGALGMSISWSSDVSLHPIFRPIHSGMDDSDKAEAAAAGDFR